jgi:ADP-heptose:LPS heptosyltransferase
MGDVLLTEPIAAELAPSFDRIAICTEFEAVARLLPTYDEIIPYVVWERNELKEFAQVITPLYEIYPGCNHLDGFAQHCGVTLSRRIPKIRGGSTPIVNRPYLLIAPETSSWIRHMRAWPFQRFAAVRDRLKENLAMDVIFLEASHSFEEMVSLIEHCSAFLGNDSGPALLAQCFDKACFVIFGATSPAKILVSPKAIPIHTSVQCIGCKHWARHTEITCASPICLQSLSVDHVVSVVLENILQSRHP